MRAMEDDMRDRDRGGGRRGDRDARAEAIDTTTRTPSMEGLTSSEQQSMMHMRRVLFRNNGSDNCTNDAPGSQSSSKGTGQKQQPYHSHASSLRGFKLFFWCAVMLMFFSCFWIVTRPARDNVAQSQSQFEVFIHKAEDFGNYITAANPSLSNTSTSTSNSNNNNSSNEKIQEESGSSHLHLSLHECESALRTYVEDYDVGAGEPVGFIESSNGNKQDDFYDMLYFMHPPRTGGRTFNYCVVSRLFERQDQCKGYSNHSFLSKSSSLSSSDAHNNKNTKSNTTTTIAAAATAAVAHHTHSSMCKVFSSHDDFSFGDEILKANYSHVWTYTNMRDPVSRLMSMYEFALEIASRSLLHPIQSIFNEFHIHYEAPRPASAGRNVTMSHKRTHTDTNTDNDRSSMDKLKKFEKYGKEDEREEGKQRRHLSVDVRERHPYGGRLSNVTRSARALHPIERYAVERTKRSRTQAMASNKPTSGPGGRTTDIWPWSVLVPLFQKTSADKISNLHQLLKPDSSSKPRYGSVYENDYYMSLSEFIEPDDPKIFYTVHNQLTYQILGISQSAIKADWNNPNRADHDTLSSTLRTCSVQYKDNIGHALVELAKKRLSNNVVHFGLFEHYEESAKLFADSVFSEKSRASFVRESFQEKAQTMIDGLHKCMVGISGRNKSKTGNSFHAILKLLNNFESVDATKLFSSSTRSDLPENVVEKIKQYNFMDIELYAHAKKVFEKRLELIDSKNVNAIM